MKRETEWVQYQPSPGDRYAPSATPLYQTATFRLNDKGDNSVYGYTRSGNPTRRVVEDQLARVEGGSSAFAFSSGMAAITAACALVSSGEEILACVDLYGGTYRLLCELATRQGIRVRYVDTSDPDALARAFDPGLESHPDYEVAGRLLQGFGGVVTFEVEGDYEATVRFVDRCRIPYIAPSLGGVESLIEMPVLMSYWDQTPEARHRFGITDSLVRFSCGIEDTVDLIDDLEQALRAV